VTVYFVQAGEGGPIKIGFAANAKLRIDKIRVDCPDELIVLGVIDGGPGDESWLHGYFAEHKKRGEWFHPVPELLAYIANHPKRRDIVRGKRGGPRYSTRPRSTPMSGPHSDAIAAWERRLDEARVSVNAVCRQADMDATTFFRWKRYGIVPRVKLWRRFEAAASQLIAGAA
jgi:hypothetical protein